MFTGIVEGLASLQSIKKTKAGLRFGIKPKARLNRLKIGESISVNGVCLTLVQSSPKQIEFDVAKESLKVTTLGQLKKGSLLNLERALQLGDRLGGHLVSGHIDCIGKLEKIKVAPNGAEWTISLPKKFARYVIQKGSICIDGASLTINRVSKAKAGLSFSVFLIPHTLSQTNFHARQRGDRLNLEVDIMAKYIEKMLPGAQE